MRFLEGKLGDAQFNDLAAYIAGKLGGTPSYLQVVAMPVPVLAPASLNFGAADLLSDDADADRHGQQRRATPARR